MAAMSQRDSTITRDEATIREWAEEHDREVVPVRVAGGETEEYLITTETEDRHEKLSWDGFFDHLDRNDKVVVYHGAAADRPFEVVSRDEAVVRASTEDETIGETLLEGETVTTEIKETTVIERTIVEEATVESELVDRRTVEEEFVDTEFVARSVESCEVHAPETKATEGRVDADFFETGYRTTEGFDEFSVEADVTEDWTVTREVLEQLTIESRVVDTDVTETDTVESDTVETTVDVEGVRESILESDLLDSDVVVSDLGSEAVRTEYGEGERDRITTQLFERKTVEGEVVLNRRLTGGISEGETGNFRTVDRRVVEAEIADEDREFVAIEGGTGEMESTTAGTATGETDTTAAETGTAATGRAGDHPIPTDDEEGKTVVDATGDNVGTVVEVAEGVIYVEPHHTLTDRIEAALGWDEMDKETYPIDANRIKAITDDRIELKGTE